MNNQNETTATIPQTTTAEGVTSSDGLGDWEQRRSAHVAEIKRLSDLLASEREGILAADREIARLRHGVEKGSIVQYRGALYRVTGVTGGYGKPWATGNPKRKDGSWGTAERNLYSDWELSPNKQICEPK